MLTLKLQMHKPTKAMTQFLFNKLRYLPDNMEQIIARKFKERKHLMKNYLKSIS